MEIASHYESRNYTHCHVHLIHQYPEVAPALRYELADHRARLLEAVPVALALSGRL